MASSARRLSFNWFLSSTWTDLPVDRRPELVAEALSWLSGASQAPDVFRAIVFALGDLDVGLQVGEHTSTALRTRLRAEIRRTWQQVDFLTLSRYVLADRNILGDPVLDYDQFKGRFDMSNESALRCEDGLAAVIRVDPDHIYNSDIVQYSPDHVAQPRMHELLLPHTRKSQELLTDNLIVLTTCYRAHLWTRNSFNLGNLEAHLYQTLDADTRNAYATAVTVNYGGIPGAIELLTFLCLHGVIYDITKAAAVELVMELLEHPPYRERRCLAYLFGSSELWDATWKDKHWSPGRLSSSLCRSCFQPCEPSSVRTLSDDWQFDLAVARTAVMMLSPRTPEFGWEANWIRFLHGHLYQPPLRSHPDNDVIRLILESAALIGIVGTPNDYGFARGIDIWRTTILVAIVRDLSHCLRDRASTHNGEQLLAALARAEVKGPDGEICTWDLGEWLRTDAPKIQKKGPSCTAAMRDVHDALGALHPLCEHNPKLRASWNLIGYSGPPEEIVYFCDPYLDLGEFFARAEDPLSQSGVW